MKFLRHELGSLTVKQISRKAFICFIQLLKTNKKTAQLYFSVFFKDFFMKHISTPLIYHCLADCPELIDLLCADIKLLGFYTLEVKQWLNNGNV